MNRNPYEDSVRSMSELVPARQRSAAEEEDDEEEEEEEIVLSTGSSSPGSDRELRSPIRHRGDTEVTVVTGNGDLAEKVDAEDKGKPKKKREYKLKVFVALLFAVIISSVTLIFHFYNHQKFLVEIGRKIKFQEDTRILTVINTRKDEVLHGKLGMGFQPDWLLPYDCTGSADRDKHLCLKWKNHASLTIDYTQEGSTNCYRIQWQSLRESYEPRDCFMLSGSHWYGGGQVHQQLWPLEQITLPDRPFITGVTHDPNTFGSVLERYWLTSKGAAIFVDNDVPLFVSINQTGDDSGKEGGKLCLRARYNQAPFPDPPGKMPWMNYTVCTDDDMLKMHQKALMEQDLQPPGVPPNTDLLKKPILSTLPHLKRNFSQDQVVQFVQDVKNSGVDIGYVSIDDQWEDNYGDLTFDPQRFANASKMISDLHNLGLQVYLWLHPYNNADSYAFREAIKKDLMVQDAGGNVPGLTRWWNGPRTPEWGRGVAAAIDMLNNASKHWISKRIQTLKDTFKIDAFKFDGGEITTLPYNPNFKLSVYNLNLYSSMYAELASSFGPMSVVRVGTRSQHLPLFVHIYDKNSTWEYENGLKSLIPTVLTMGLLGYPFIIPPPIGGNAFDGAPSKELYIRWLQVTTFLPVFHFSIPPHVYDKETTDIAKEMIDRRKAEVLPKLLKAFREASTTLHPVIRPLWWVAPKDQTAHTLDDEFLVGEDILVAPVLEEGATMRDIYFPEGTQWRDQLYGGVRKGGTWKRAYHVSISQVPYFVRIVPGKS